MLVAVATREPVGIRAQHLRPRETVLPIEIVLRCRTVRDFDGEQVTAGQHWLQRVACQLPETLVSVNVGWDRNSAEIDDLFHDLDDGRIGRSLVSASFAVVSDGSEQAVDVAGLLAGIEDGEHMRAAACGDLGAREQIERPILSMRLVLQAVHGRLEPIDPLAGIVIGDRDAVDARPHEIKQPVSRRYRVWVAIVRRCRGVGVEVRTSTSAAPG